MKTLTAHPFKSLLSVGAGGALGAGIATLAKQDQKIPAAIGALLSLGGYYIYQRRQDKVQETLQAAQAALEEEKSGPITGGLINTERVPISTIHNIPIEVGQPSRSAVSAVVPQGRIVSSRS